MKHLSPRLAGIALAAVLLGSTSTLTLAQTANVVLENISLPAKDKGTATFKRIEVTGTNLSKDELTKLFSGSASKDEAAALAKKMKAEKISIPEFQVTSLDSNFVARDFLATNINEGKVGSAVLKSVEGKGKAKGGDVAFKAGALEVQGISFTRALDAVSGGDFTDAASPVGKLTFAGFEMTAPDEDTPASAPGGNLYKISLASFTADGTSDGDIPLKGKGELKSLVVEPPKGSSFGKQLAGFGYDKLNLGLVFSGEYDKAKKTYSLDNFTISGVNAGSLGLKVMFGGVEPAFFTAKKDAKLASVMGADVSSVSVRFGNSGLFEKAVDFMAKQQKKTADALKKEWAGMVQIVPMMLGGDPAGAKIADAAGKFIASPKSLTISAKAKGKPLKFADLMQIRDPQQLLALIDLDAVSGQ